MHGRHEIRSHTDVDHLPVRQRPLPEGCPCGQILWEGERVVDQDIEAALLAPHLLEQCCDLIVIAVVDPNRDACAAPHFDFGRGLTDRAG